MAPSTRRHRRAASTPVLPRNVQVTQLVRTKLFRGFSLVEFVIIIVLIGIVSVVALSRMLGGNTFNGAVIRDQIIAATRNSRQNALGRSGITLTVQPNGSASSVEILTTDSGGAVDSISTDMSGVVLSGDINETDSCAVTNGANTVSNATPLVLNFQELGDLSTGGVTGSTGSISSAVRVCINNDSALSLCISPSGFAYAGDCDV